MEVPRELPAAHLYLEDVEQTCSILSDADRANWPQRPIEVSFSSKDLRMDSIEDLKIHGGSTTEFSIGVAVLGVEFHYYKDPTIHLYSLDSESAWATYSKVKAILDARQFAVKNAFARLPYWFRVTLWVLVVFIFPALLLARTRWFVDAAYWIALAAVFFVMIRPSRISFVHSHERSKVATQNRKGYIKAVILLFVGAIIGKLVEIASQWIKTR